jgi:ubiquinone/menaquinone biosynthesis C-methylase UbiE
MAEQDKTLNANHLIKETVKRYDEIAEEYSGDWRGQIDVTEPIKPAKFEKLVGSSPRKILDAGCGTGKHSIYFAERGYDVYGIDRSSGMIGEAVKNSVGLKINFAMEDMRSLSFPNNFFDGMWTVAAITHLPLTDKRKFIQEAHRVLKPNGILYIELEKGSGTFFRSSFGF